ncbi:hypothetical protein AGLY_009598 [Aphis glycines]|uniref:Uncharacterized protein n=1 Tax=Aphis glycines TaxID=307491 RepID=A0A6G0TK52_APHGL|nr:hypothetical protein AGLY_009598 [Aphis glycines]
MISFMSFMSDLNGHNYVFLARDREHSCDFQEMFEVLESWKYDVLGRLLDLFPKIFPSKIFFIYFTVFYFYEDIVPACVATVLHTSIHSNIKTNSILLKLIAYKLYIIWNKGLKCMTYSMMGKWVPFYCSLGDGVDLRLGITYEELCIQFSKQLIRNLVLNFQEFLVSQKFFILHLFKTSYSDRTIFQVLTLKNLVQTVLPPIFKVYFKNWLPI